MPPTSGGGWPSFQQSAVSVSSSGSFGTTQGWEITLACTALPRSRRLNSRAMHSSENACWKRHIFALLLFGTAFGYLEAAVVSYLRLLHEPIRQQYYPGRSPSELFPLLTREQVATGGPQQHSVLVTEVGREAATIIMLAAVSLAVATNIGQWAAMFAIAFGTWDITFYLFLRVLLGWPESLFTWDILFLIPAPWVGPVLAPVLVSAAMIVAGIWHLWRDAMGRPVCLGGWNWAGIAAGAVTIVISFTLDRENISAGGMPRPFAWGVFALGMAVGALGYVSAAVGSRVRRERSVAA